jgi:hypothetical protein
MINGGANPNNVFHVWHGENIGTHAEINEASTKFFNSDLDHLYVTGNERGAFLDDGKTRYKNPTLTADTGTITLNTGLSKISYQEKDGRMFVAGYLHVASVSGSPTGVLHLTDLSKPCLTGTQNRSVGTAALSEFNAGSGAASGLCRVMEGASTIDIFGADDGVLKYLAPYLRTDSNITFSINYPVR